jgi:hypothetical protein
LPRQARDKRREKLPPRHFVSSQAEHERAVEAASQSTKQLRQLEGQLGMEGKAATLAEEEARVAQSAKHAAEDEQRRAAAEAERLRLDLETLRAESARTLRNQLNMQQQQADGHNIEAAELRLRLRQAEAAEANSRAAHAAQLTQTELVRDDDASLRYLLTRLSCCRLSAVCCRLPTVCCCLLCCLLASNPHHLAACLLVTY